MCVVLALAGCAQQKSDPTFVGSFQDEFGNKFALNADQSATIEFVNTGKIIPTTWEKLDADSARYAAIAFNGDPSYYILKDERTMFRHADDLNANRAAISIQYSAE